MAKKTPSNPASERPSRLLLPPEEVRARLAERIAAASNFLAPAYSSRNELEIARKSYYSWSEYNGELLRRLFDTEQEFNEYRFAGRTGFLAGGPTSLNEDVQDFHDDVDYKLRKLKSLMERLELYTLSPSVQVPEASASAPSVITGNKVFVVHGRDVALREAVARTLQTLGFEPVILNEQADKGRTIIQKFEDYAGEAIFAVVLLTPDDMGRLGSDDAKALMPRARQNVILELGYFLAKLGQDRVCAIHTGNVELPSDVAGRLYIPYDDAGMWRFRLAKEMQAAQILVDLNKL